MKLHVIITIGWRWSALQKRLALYKSRPLLLLFVKIVFNPFTAPACKISRLNDARTVYILRSYNIYFQCYTF